MINFKTSKYCQSYCGAYLSEYIKNKKTQDARLNYIMIFLLLAIILALIGISKPIFAKTDTGPKVFDTGQSIFIQKNFEENIKNKYAGSYVAFPAKGIAHIKRVKYINSKPIRINIAEINTNVNPYLKIKPETAGRKLNSKTTVGKIARKDNAIIAINGGFFKPATGAPLGALMIDENILSGPVFNRVGIAIFENNGKTSFKMMPISFDIKAYTRNKTIKIDNINQPRMSKYHTLLYTSDWNNESPVAPKECANALIENNHIVKVSANPIELKEGDYVLQGRKEIIYPLVKDKEIYININLSEELQGAKHIIGAGPYLVKESKVYVDYKEQKLQAIAGKNPRSAIGFKNDGTFIIVTIDGREKASVGMTLYEEAKLMKELGCEYAMNFDGGSSSAMYVKGNIVNKAVNKEGIAVSNALVVSETNPDEPKISSL